MKIPVRLFLLLALAVVALLSIFILFGEGDHEASSSSPVFFETEQAINSPQQTDSSKTNRSANNPNSRERQQENLHSTVSPRVLIKGRALKADGSAAQHAQILAQEKTLTETSDDGSFTASVQKNSQTINLGIRPNEGMGVLLEKLNLDSQNIDLGDIVLPAEIAVEIHLKFPADATPEKSPQIPIKYRFFGAELQRLSTDRFIRRSNPAYVEGNINVSENQKARIPNLSQGKIRIRSLDSNWVGQIQASIDPSHSNVTLELFPSAVIEGEVFSESGIALPNASIVAQRSSESWQWQLQAYRPESELVVPSQAISDQNGRFALHGLIAGEYKLVAKCPGFTPTALWNVSTGSKGIRIELKKAPRIEGRILPQKHPFPDRFQIAALWAGKDFGKGHPFRKYALDWQEFPFGERGEFYIDEIEEGDYLILARAPGFGQSEPFSLSIRAGQTQNNLEIFLAVAASISGRVLVNGSEEVIADAKILATYLPEKRIGERAKFNDEGGSYYPEERFTAVSNENGNFALSDLPAGSYRIVSSHRDYLVSDDIVTNCVLGQNSSVNLYLKEGGYLEGRVLDEKGNGVAAQNVLAENRSDDSYSVQSDTNGNYSFPPIPAGMYSVTLGGKGAVLLSGSDLSDLFTVEVHLGKTTLHNLVANQRVNIKGRVTTGKTALAKAKVIFRKLSGSAIYLGSENHVLTEEDGSFEWADLANGNYQISVQPQNSSVELKKEWVMNDSVYSFLNLELPTASIHGHCQIRTGDPKLLPGSRLRLQTKTKNDSAWSVAWAELALDSEGAFSFSYLPQGEYLLDWRGEGGKTHSQSVKLEEGKRIEIAISIDL